jgi:hypothetical protein
MKVIRKKYGIEITKPWLKEMYEWNDTVAKLIKIDLYTTLKKMYEGGATKAEMNDLASTLGPKYGDGYEINDIYDSIYKEIVNAPNYLLNEELDYLIKKGYITEPKYRFVGYDK